MRQTVCQSRIFRANDARSYWVKEITREREKEITREREGERERERDPVDLKYMELSRKDRLIHLPGSE